MRTVGAGSLTAIAGAKADATGLNDGDIAGVTKVTEEPGFL